MIPEKCCWSSVSVPRTWFFLRFQRYPHANRGAEASWLLHTSGGLKDATSSWMLTAQCPSSRGPQTSISFVRRDIQQQVSSHRKGNCWGLHNMSFHQFVTVTPVPWMLFSIHLLTAVTPDVQERGGWEREMIPQMPMGSQKSTRPTRNSDKIWATGLGNDKSEHTEKQTTKKLVKAVEEKWIKCIVRI